MNHHPNSPLLPLMLLRAKLFFFFSMRLPRSGFDGAPKKGPSEKENDVAESDWSSGTEEQDPLANEEGERWRNT